MIPLLITGAIAGAVITKAFEDKPTHYKVYAENDKGHKYAFLFTEFKEAKKFYDRIAKNMKVQYKIIVDNDEIERAVYEKELSKKEAKISLNDAVTMESISLEIYHGKERSLIYEKNIE